MFWLCWTVLLKFEIVKKKILKIPDRNVLSHSFQIFAYEFFKNYEQIMHNWNGEQLRQNLIFCEFRTSGLFFLWFENDSGINRQVIIASLNLSECFNEIFKWAFSSFVRKVFLVEEELHSTFFAILHNTSKMVSRLYRQANGG